jgi:thiol-disulfide isomerase/thioredoxin
MGQYRDDVFVQQAYIRSTRTAPEKDKVIAQYRSAYEQNPANAQLAYLYGLTLVGRDTPGAIKLFNDALEKAPSFALPRLELVTIYRSRAFLDKPQSASQLKTFLDACPSSLEGYQALAQVDDKELMRSYAPKLRTLIEDRSDPDAVGAYRALWSLEFKAHAASEYGPLRSQVSEDLARLRQLDLQDEPEWYLSLENGYTLVNNKKQADWAADQYMTHFNPEPVAIDKWWDQQLDQKKIPGPGASPATIHAFYSAMFAESGHWVKEGPNSQMPWAYRLQAIENLDDIPAAVVETNVEQALQFSVRDDGPVGVSSGGYGHLAAILSEKHVEPQRVVELADKALAQWEIESKEPPNDLESKDQREKRAADRAFNRIQWLGYEIDGYLQLKEGDKAEPELDRMNRWLQDFKSLPGRQDSARAEAGLSATYWALRAREAELQGHRQDAMGFYENALLSRLTAQQEPAAGRRDELADNAHQLWKSLGGTEEGWQLWYAHPANDLASQTPAVWEDADEPLPAFQLADLSGNTWNLAALKGKTVFMDFWASWCAPCRSELSRLQKLAGQYKDRPDVRFITMNLDANPGLAQSAAKELALSMVVILAYSYAKELKTGPFPANWIVDANGVVRLKGGYNTGEKWEAGVKEAIERVKSLPAETPAGGAPH